MAGIEFSNVTSLADAGDVILGRVNNSTKPTPIITLKSLDQRLGRYNAKPKKFTIFIWLFIAAPSFFRSYSHHSNKNFPFDQERLLWIYSTASPLKGAVKDCTVPPLTVSPIIVRPVFGSNHSTSNSSNVAPRSTVTVLSKGK